MIRTVCAALAAGLLVPTLARAQDFAGRFDLEGRDSLGRRVTATLKVTSDAGALAIDRSGKVYAGSTPAAATRWRSATARLVSPRVLRATFKLAVPGASAGLVAGLDPDHATTDAALSALSAENVLEAVYFLAADGQSVREVVLNTTRAAPERWRSLEARGRRVTAPIVAIGEAELQARVGRAVRAWYGRYTDEVYAGLLADATSAAERARLVAARARDRDFAATCELSEGDDLWASEVDDRYAGGDGYRDANGAVVPRAKVRIFALSFAPEHAGIGLGKVFVFDGRTGAVLEEGDVTD